MGDGYVHRSLSDFDRNEKKPGMRWELSPQLGLDAYNLNVAILESGERLSQNAYHYHENQTECYYVVSGRCRAEVDDGSFDLDPDAVLVVNPGEPHMLHNPFDAPCTVIAIGDPPEGRYPVHQIESYEELLADRYEADPTEADRGE